MKRKIISLFLVLWSVLCLFCLTACNATLAVTLLSSEEKKLVIRIDEAQDGAKLIDALQQLKETNQLDFEIVGGMITSVNGKEGEATGTNSGYSWIIYTSNSELSFPAYTKTYENIVCYSAAFGAESLAVQKGETIILSYDEWSF